MLLISQFVICVQNCYMLVHIWKCFGLKEIIPKMTIMKDSCHEQSVVVAWLLVGDWSVVGGVGGDNSVRIHHVLTSQVGLTHFLQAEWRQREGGRSQSGNTYRRCYPACITWSLTPDIIHQHYQGTVLAAEHSVHAVGFDMWVCLSTASHRWCESKGGVKYLSSCVRDNSPAARFCRTTVDARSLSTNTPAHHAHLTHLCLTHKGPHL